MFSISLQLVTSELVTLPASFDLEFPVVSEFATSELVTFPASFDLEFPAVYISKPPKQFLQFRFRFDNFLHIMYQLKVTSDKSYTDDANFPLSSELTVNHHIMFDFY